MTVTFVSDGNYISGVSSATPAWPSAPSGGTIAVAIVDSGHPTIGTVPACTDDGWAFIGSFAGGGGAYGPDAGARRLTLFIRQLQGDEADPPSFTIPPATDSRVGAIILFLAKTAANVTRYAASLGEDTVSGTGFSALGLSTIPFAVNDFIALAYALASDAANPMSAEAITAAGITFSAITEQRDAPSTVGADVGRAYATGSVTVGTATVAPTIAATLTGASTGVASALRVRDVAPDTGPGTITLAYDAVTSKVTVMVAGLDAAAALADVERSTDGINWRPVRRGKAATVTAGGVVLTDYEFGAGVLNTYRVTGYNVGLVITDIETATITPVLDRVWLKSPARPFLNRPVTCVGYSEIERPARSATYDPVGRSFPIAVGDLRGSKRWDLELYTATADDGQTMDYTLASGDVLLVHTPLGCRVPGGYVRVADTGERRPRARGESRVFTLPCTEVAPPGPDVGGADATWASVLAAYPSWSAVLAAFPTWADLLALVGKPSEVIVP